MQEMLRAFTILFVLMWFGMPAQSQSEAPVPPRPLSSAFEAMQDERWERAAELAARAGPVASALIEWHRLRAGLGTPEEVLAFLNAREDWPGLKLLRKKSEAAFETASDAQVLAFYGTGSAQTGQGVLRHAKALFATGQKGAAEAELVLAWRTMELSTDENGAFVKEYGALLAPHHEARLDMILWRGLKGSAEMKLLVSDAQRNLAEIREMAGTGKRGMDARIETLPRELRSNPGLIYARFTRFLESDKPEDASALMIAQSRSKAGLGEPQRWSGWRRSLARRMMRAQDYQTAYDLASVHQLTGGGAYADLEWLSGYLALRFLNDPARALIHFQQLQAAVASPISRGRAWYWIGRAYEASGNAGAAQAAYTQGAAYPTSFYGILAAEKAGVALPDDLSGGEVFPRWQEADFVKSPLFKAGILALSVGQTSLARRFFLKLADGQDRTVLGQLGRMLDELGQPHIQVKLGKHAAQRGIVLYASYYALHPMVDLDLPVEDEMALAIARRESEFDFSVRSSAGAEGLMQLMPGTAQDLAGDLGIAYKPSAVTRDWQYNARLGSTYLAQLAEKFDGNVVLVSIGYNAGPRRATRWTERFGDLRKGEMDVIDWIEHIPFRETRNYVQRVAESLPVYRARLGRNPLPIPFSQELVGSSVTSGLPATD